MAQLKLVSTHNINKDDGINQYEPELRFPEFNDMWEEVLLEDISELTSSKRIYLSDYVDKGIPFYRGAEITSLKKNKTIKTDLYISNEKYYELKNKFGAPKKDDILITGVGTLGNVYRIPHDDPFYFKDGNLIWLKDISENANFIECYLDYKKNDILKLAIGSTQKALTIQSLQKLKMKIPSYKEQEKIARFLTEIDKKIELLEKKCDLLKEHKKGFIQKLGKAEIKFQNHEGDYPQWEETKLKDILYEHKLKSTGNEEVYSVSVHKGVVNQIEHLGRSYATDDLSKYKLVKPGDIVYTKSPTSGFELGIIKQNKNDKNVLVSPLYGVFSPETIYLGNFIDAYFESSINTRNYLHPIVQKGAKNTMNITNKVFLSRSLLLPTDYDEQKKISDYIDLLNKKYDETFSQCENMKNFKKGLLQKMFI